MFCSNVCPNRHSNGSERCFPTNWMLRGSPSLLFRRQLQRVDQATSPPSTALLNPESAKLNELFSSHPPKQGSELIS